MQRLRLVRVLSDRQSMEFHGKVPQQLLDGRAAVAMRASAAPCAYNQVRFQRRPSDLHQNRNGNKKYRETGFFNKLLSEVLLNVPTDEAGNPTPEGLAAVRDAVENERKRVRPKKVKEPDTELGRDMKKIIRAPTRIIDRVIREAATKKLERFPVKGKPN